MGGRTIAMALFSLFGLFGASAATAQQAPPPVGSELVQRIVGDDPAAAAQATEQLVEQIAGPVTGALGALSDYPMDARLRLDDALRQAYGEMRARLFRAELPPDDRALFDRFAAAYPRVVRGLFAGDGFDRLEALDQVPLEPGTGAGVLLAGCVGDRDPSVSERALDLAMRLKDDVVARNLGRYVAEVMKLVDSGWFKRNHPAYELVIGQNVHRAIRIVGASRAAGATDRAGGADDAGDPVPSVIAAVRHFATAYDVNLWDVGEIMEALGQLGDERTAEVMLPFLGNATIRRSNVTADGDRATQSIGDAALHALLKIYRLDPARFGFVYGQDGTFYGFVGAAQRQRAQRAFRAWHHENAGKPLEQRGAPRLEPAGAGEPPCWN